VGAHRQPAGLVEAVVYRRGLVDLAAATVGMKMGDIRRLVREEAMKPPIFAGPRTAEAKDRIEHCVGVPNEREQVFTRWPASSAEQVFRGALAGPGPPHHDVDRLMGLAEFAAQCRGDCSRVDDPNATPIV